MKIFKPLHLCCIYTSLIHITHTQCGGGDFHVIPHHDAVSRDTGKITRKIHFPL